MGHLSTAFYTLVSARYEHGSSILISHKGFGEWGELLGDGVIASAVLDRLLHPRHVLKSGARVTGSGRSGKPGCYRPNITSSRRRRRPATTMPTDRIAEQQTRRWVNFKPAIASVIDGVGQSRIGEPGSDFCRR